MHRLAALAVLAALLAATGALTSCGSPTAADRCVQDLVSTNALFPGAATIVIDGPSAKTACDPASQRTASPAGASMTLHPGADPPSGDPSCRMANPQDPRSTVAVWQGTGVLAQAICAELQMAGRPTPSPYPTPPPPPTPLPLPTPLRYPTPVPVPPPPPR
jgi:hypothetical protein